MTSVVDKKSIEAIASILLDPEEPLDARFRALFTLRNVGGPVAIDCISKCFVDPSALLKHELAYCLGQMQDNYAIPKLTEVLKDTDQEAMVRHEAGEALGAIGAEEVVDLLEKYSKDPVIEVAETCQLAVRRIKWLHSKDADKMLTTNPYMSVDPAPPSEEQNVEQLKTVLLDEDLPLFKRYRAMFSLRNNGSTDSVLALAEGLKCSSALFRHEIAYVLGQMQMEAAVKQLKINLEDGGENPMVRHECAEALGSIATKECMEILDKFLGDKDRVVKESCEVALDMSKYMTSSEQFQYADGLNKVEHSDNLP